MESSYTHIILRISNRIESDYRDCLFTTDLVSPSIMEQNNYLPFGSRLPLTDPAYDFGNRWRYAAKEEQRFGPADLGLLDFGARMYDPFTARWTAVDPMAAKYPSHSPFNYCEGSPINRIDPQGDTIVVLYARNAVGGLGHMAILIQDENGVYRLWSKNGDKFDDDIHKDNKGIAITSIEDFLDNQANYIKQTENSESPYYTEGYMIATTSEQDAKIKETMEGELNNNYHLLNSNCGQAVMNALESAGVPTKKNWKEGKEAPKIKEFFYFVNHTVPAKIMPRIRRANPGGQRFRPSR